MEDNSSNTVRSIYLIRNTLEHSISPQIHNAAFEYEHLPYEYKIKQVQKQDLPHVLEEFKKDGTVGFNVTIPYKTTIIQYLDKIKPVAREIGAVNTVKIENGELIGINTDIDGIKNACKNSNYFPVKNDNIVLVGAGGAARAVAFFYSKFEVNLIILNRTLENAEKLHNDLNSQSIVKAALDYHSLHAPQIEKIFQSANLIINATPIGMWPHVNDSILSNYVPKPSQCVFDLVYNHIETQLVKIAKKNGCKIISGLDMLLYQAVKAFRWWTDVNPKLKLMKKVAIDCLTSISSK